MSGSEQADESTAETGEETVVRCAVTGRFFEDRAAVRVFRERWGIRKGAATEVPRESVPERESVLTTTTAQTISEPVCASVAPRKVKRVYREVGSIRQTARRIGKSHEATRGVLARLGLVDPDPAPTIDDVLAGGEIDADTPWGEIGEKLHHARNHDGGGNRA